ncbi:alpha/beta hydrolase [Luteibacter sp. E-22]|uniref:alpha/beta hydrolase n=1 Tax=Luteibacter sp. E-22 TaxID=3404050 RepID=UPI003CFB61BB
MPRITRFLLVLGIFLTGCQGHQDGAAAATGRGEKPKANASEVSVAPGAVAKGQPSNGSPYELLGSEVWDVPDPESGRTYQVFVALPQSYGEQPERRYPVLYVTDADYAFPIVRQLLRRLNGEGPAIKEFILVGLSYAVGEEGMPSRRRDYTPTASGNDDAPPGAVHGQGEAYISYLRDRVFPFVAQHYRTDEHERIFLGHSYGGLLGTQILLTRPQLFSAYLLGSPSYWYGEHVMQRMETGYAKDHRDLPARVYLYVGQYEEPRYGKKHSMVADAAEIVRALRSRHYPSLQVTFDVLSDEDHLSVAPRGFTHGLKVLLPDHGP